MPHLFITDMPVLLESNSGRRERTMPRVSEGLPGKPSRLHSAQSRAGTISLFFDTYIVINAHWSVHANKFNFKISIFLLVLYMTIFDLNISLCQVYRDNEVHHNLQATCRWSDTTPALL